MQNNQKINIDWKFCFTCQQQGKEKLSSTPHKIKSLSSNLFRFWWLGVLDNTCSTVTSTLHDEAELENYLTEKEAKYHKVCAYCYDSQKLQLSCTICNIEDLSENLHTVGSYHAKRKVVNVQHNKNFIYKWKEMALNSENASLLALIPTGDLAEIRLFTMYPVTNQSYINQISSNILKA